MHSAAMSDDRNIYIVPAHPYVASLAGKNQRITDALDSITSRTVCNSHQEVFRL